MLLSLAFGVFPPQSSLQLALSSLAGDLIFKLLPEVLPCRSMPSSRLSQAIIVLQKSPMPHLDVTAETVLRIARLHEPLQNHSAFGSLRRLPIHAHAAIRATLRSHVNRPGLPPLALRVSRICQPYFMLGRPWAPSLQRLLSIRAAVSSRTRLSPLPFATLRCCGSEDLSVPVSLAPCDALLTANGCVHYRRRFHI
jgi:hypothetical protein